MKGLRTVVAALVFALAASSALHADLKYTMRAEMKPAPAGSTAPANPLLAMFSASMVQQLLPGGPAEIVYFVSDKGVRTEYKQAALGNAAGTVVLVRPNGDTVSMDTNAKTYWKATAATLTQAMAQLPVAPKVTTKRTEEFANVAGVRSRRIGFDISIDLPIPAEMLSQLPPGFPTAITMNGDIWVAADQYKDFAAMVAKGAGALRAMGFDKLMVEGVMLRQIMRSDLFNGQMFEVTTTQIAEEKVDPALFEIPAGYKEVASPFGGIGGAAR